MRSLSTLVWSAPWPGRTDLSLSSASRSTQAVDVAFMGGEIEAMGAEYVRMVPARLGGALASTFARVK